MSPASSSCKTTFIIPMTDLNRTLLLRLLPLASCSFAVAFQGCSGSDASDNQRDSAGLACTRDPALLESAARCISDEDCPCGSYCDQGQCGFDCADDDDCGGEETCSVFGRCGERDATFPQTEPFSIRPASLSGVDAEQPATFWITAGSRALGRIDLRTEGGVEVSCDGETFESSCAIESLGARAERSVRVRGRLDPSASGLVRVQSGPWSESVTVAGPGESVRAPVPGRYRGEARLVAAGASSTALSPLPEHTPSPLEAQIYEGAGDGFVIALRDPVGLVLPRTEWVGELIPVEEGFEVSFPDVVRGPLPITTEISTEISTRFEPTIAAFGGRTLAFASRLSFEGTSTIGEVPAVEFRLSLQRVSDNDPNATPPSIPVDEVLRREPSEAESTPSSWESAFQSVREPYSIARIDLQDRALEAYEAAGVRLDACGLSRTALNVVANRGTLEAIQGDDGTRAGTIDVSWPRLSASADYFNEPALRDSSNFLLAAIGEHIFPSEQFTADFRLELASSDFGYDPALDDAIYCAFEYDETRLSVSSPGEAFTIPANQIDRCDQIATRYGCAVEDLDRRVALRNRLSLIGNARRTGSAFVYNQPGPEPRIYGTRVCHLPRNPESCGVGLSCYEAGSFDPDLGSLDAPDLTGQPAPASGDLLCRGEERSLANALYDLALLDADSPDRLDAATAFDVCRTELEAFRAASAPDSPARNAAGLDEIVEEARCVDPVRILLNLGLVRAVDANPFEQALLHRRAQQWLRVHGFLARNAAERERFAAIIRSEDTDAPPATPQSILATSLDGWAFLFHPRFGGQLRALSPQVLAAPDYRTRAVPEFSAGLSDQPQPRGVSVDIVETLTAQLELADRAWQRDDGEEVSTQVRRLLEALPVAVALARDLVRQADGAGPVAWLDRYREAERSMFAALSNLLGTGELLLSGANPLGIEEDDLPLYFFGNQVGAGGRFLAISDYLLGDGPESNAWAPFLVRQAAATLQGARQAWVEREQRQMLASLDANARERREDEVRLRYGNAITDLCGPIPGVATREILDLSTSIDPDLCFMRFDNPDCSLSTDEYLQSLTPEMVAREICVIGRLKTRAGRAAGFLDPRLDAMADNHSTCREPSLSLNACPGGGGPSCYSCAGMSAPIAPDSFRQVRLDAIDPALVDRVREQCGRRWWRAPPLPTLRELRPGGDENPSCFQGSLGEMSLTVRSVAQQVEAARSRIQDKSDAYDVAMRSCFRRYFGERRLIEAQEEHDEVMSELRRAKLSADRRAVEAAAVKDCATAYGGDWTYGAASGAACYAASAEGRAQIDGLNLQFMMEEVQQRHDAHMAELEAEVERRVCFNDAEMHLVGARTAAIELDQAQTDLQRALVQFQNTKSSVQTKLDEGRSVLELVREQTVAHPVHDFWLDERLAEFEREMRLAKRTSFLAARAVEYEMQASLEVRDLILDAIVPVELEAALDELRLTAATRRINGRAPSNLKAVVSLKDELLQLEDRSEWPEFFYRFGKTERLRRLLGSPRFAVYSSAGDYLGQRIPFSLAPLGTLGLADPRGIALLTGGDCAERLWSVNASVQGSEDVVAGGSTSVRIDVLKSNEFHSQWCSSVRPDDVPFQRASVRPSRNLFREPGLGSEVGAPLGLQNPNIEESRGRIQARVNVPRAELESDAFTDGSTTELAARGLYGSYALFIPAEVLKDPSDPDSRGLDLDAVDDILLRFDYVSVAR